MRIILESKKDAVRRRKLELENFLHQRTLSRLQTYFLIICSILFATAYLIYLYFN